MSCEQAISAPPFPPHLPTKPSGAGKRPLSTASVAAGLKRSKPLTQSLDPRRRSDGFREHRSQSIPSLPSPRNGVNRELRSQSPSASPRLLKSGFSSDGRSQSPSSSPRLLKSGFSSDGRSQSPSSSPRLLNSGFSSDGRSQSPSSSPRLLKSGFPSDGRSQSPGSSPRLRGDAHRDLPPGWERVQSDQGMYYWHKETQRTRWKFPDDEGEEPRVKHPGGSRASGHPMIMLSHIRPSYDRLSHGGVLQCK